MNGCLVWVQVRMEQNKKKMKKKVTRSTRNVLDRPQAEEEKKKRIIASTRLPTLKRAVATQPTQNSCLQMLHNTRRDRQNQAEVRGIIGICQESRRGRFNVPSEDTNGDCSRVQTPKDLGDGGGENAPCLVVDCVGSEPEGTRWPTSDPFPEDCSIRSRPSFDGSPTGPRCH